ncbi:Crp/Fnr family transcriptional regulator [Puteibacter caeruleilacunae]|nr:Crp/Fnr family transcriptional regulator [Puteibacter caeruleilacunae]
MELEQLFKHIESFFQNNTILTNDEKHFIESKAKLSRVKKKAIIHEASKRCKNDYYIVSGALRIFFIDKEGKEQTVYIGVEDNWAGDLSGYFEKTGSKFFIQAIEDSVILSLSYDDIESLSSEFNHLAVYGRKRIIESHGQIVSRLVALLSESATERFDDFMNTSAHLVNRIPNYILASLLGMSPEYFSKRLTKWKDKS